jgi:hypothetical protein
MTNKINTLINAAQDIVIKTSDLLHSCTIDCEKRTILESAAKDIHYLFESNAKMNFVSINKSSLQEEAVEYVKNHPVLKPFFSQLFPEIKFPHDERIFVKCDIGFGHHLTIRGSNDPLSWEKGVPMQNLAANLWQYEIGPAHTKSFEYKIVIVFKDHNWDWEAGANHDSQKEVVVAPDFTRFDIKEPLESHQEAAILNTIYVAQSEFEKIKAKYQEEKQSSDWKEALSELKSRITPLFKGEVQVLPSSQERNEQNTDYPIYLAPFVSQMALIFFDQNLKKIENELAKNISDINMDSIKCQLIPLLILCDIVPNTLHLLLNKIENIFNSSCVEKRLILIKSIAECNERAK